MLSLFLWFVKSKVVRICTMASFMVLLLQSNAWAEKATIEEARQVSRNWLNYLVFQQGQWSGETMPKVMEGQEIIEDGAVLGYYFPVSPNGYIAVPILKELPPIKAYSEKYRLDLNATQGFTALLKEVLLHRTRLYAKRYGSLNSIQPPNGEVLFGREHKLEWNRFLRGGKEFEADLIQGKFEIQTEMGPLLTTAWDQYGPYNNSCPMGDGGRCVVGCVATAFAQIMKYWNWPTYGRGNRSYEWDGDDSCDGSVGGGTLSATFSDAYDWQNMPDNCGGGCSTAEEAALAELSYEAGVSVRMDYGRCASGALSILAIEAFPNYFRYNHPDKQYRDDYDTADDWFSIIQTEINNGRPMLYSMLFSTGNDISKHAIVCDGWMDTGGQKQYHINYGWGGPYTGWYAIDQMYGAEDPMAESLIRYIQPAYKTLLCGSVFDFLSSEGPLNPSDSPYCLTCDIVVPTECTLTIQPGVEIYFESASKITVNGLRLTANGTPGSPIYLVSENVPDSGMKLMGDLLLHNGGQIKIYE